MKTFVACTVVLIAPLGLIVFLLHIGVFSFAADEPHGNPIKR